MDATAITQMITQIGFPIAVCLICFWYIKKMQDDHKEEINKMSEAIHNNTIVMQKLVDKIGSDTNGKT